MIRTKKLEKILYSAAWAASILAFPLPVYAESELAKQVLKAVSNVSDAIVTILLGLIVLITVISLVRSGLSAQISTQFQKKYGLSREIIMVLEKVKAILAEQFDVDEDKITNDTDLQEDLGADSLDVVDLLMSIEDEFEVEVPDEEIENIKTVGALVAYIEANS